MSEEPAKYLVESEEIDIRLDYAVQYDILIEEITELKRLLKEKKHRQELIKSRLALG